METPQFFHPFREDVFMGNATQEELFRGRFNCARGDWYLAPNNLVIMRFGGGRNQFTCGYLSAWKRLPRFNRGETQ